MRKILVCFDGSEGAENALNKAITLLDNDGQLILIAVVPSKSDKIFLENNMYKKIRLKAEELLSQAIKNISHYNFKIKGLIEEGDSSAKIIDMAAKLNVDLIVLGVKSKNKNRIYSIGSVANKVVQYAHTPVMVVR